MSKANQPGMVPRLADGRPFAPVRDHFLAGKLAVFWGPGQEVDFKDNKYLKPTDWPAAGRALRVPRVVRYINDGKDAVLRTGEAYTLTEYLVAIGVTGHYGFGPQADTGFYWSGGNSVQYGPPTGTFHTDRGVGYGTPYHETIDARGPDYFYHAELGHIYAPFEVFRYLLADHGPRSVPPDFSANLAAYANFQGPQDRVDEFTIPPQHHSFDGPTSVGMSAPVPTGYSEVHDADGKVTRRGESGNPDFVI